MAEAEISGQAEKDVEADGEDAEDHQFLQQVGIAPVELRQTAGFGERVQQKRGEDQQADNDREQAEVLGIQSEHEISPP